VRRLGKIMQFGMLSICSAAFFGIALLAGFAFHVDLAKVGNWLLIICSTALVVLLVIEYRKRSKRFSK
ncbi:MAG: hypothetical protein RJQ07_01440, partial [Pseudomonadales bacterium]